MFYNIGSITLGLAAWIIAFVAICTGNRKSTCQVSSFICCCTSLLLQFYEIRRRMRMDDWIAVDDTINAICNYLRCDPSDIMRYTPDQEK